MTSSPLQARPDTGENAIRFVHDPCVIQDRGQYYLFSTGPGIPMRRSRDLVHWTAVGQVFPTPVPDWAVREVPRARGLWAPDISYARGRFQLYYCASTFGRNRSVIGLATNKTLDPDRPDYHWQDEGKVLESGPGQDYNAIDPAAIHVPARRPALVFGSFWSGIKLVLLDPQTGKPAPDAPIHALAQRPSPDAIEAPCLIHHGRYYYLFVSFDYCCRGVNSTYNTRVGRATQITGPYVDREGRELMQGGGTVVLTTQGNRIGPGGGSVLHERHGDLLVCHYYDGVTNGTPTLMVCPLTWTADGWPQAGAPLHD